MTDYKKRRNKLIQDVYEIGVAENIFNDWKNLKPGILKAFDQLVMDVVGDVIKTGVIFLTKDDVLNPEAVNKYAYARKRLREEQRTRLKEIMEGK